MKHNGKGLMDFINFIKLFFFAFRLMNTHSSNVTSEQELSIVTPLKRWVTFIKFKSSGRTYSRVYYLTLSEDAIHYRGSKRKSKFEACTKNSDPFSLSIKIITMFFF